MGSFVRRATQIAAPPFRVVPRDYLRDLTIAGCAKPTFIVSNGMEAFAAKQRQASGRNISFTPRLGLEAKVIRGWLRLRFWN